MERGREERNASMSMRVVQEKQSRTEKAGWRFSFIRLFCFNLSMGERGERLTGNTQGDALGPTKGIVLMILSFSSGEVISKVTVNVSLKS